MKKIKLFLVAIAIILLILAVVWLINLGKDSHVDIGTNSEIDITPTQIQSIKAIGQWEFLSISTEEMVDTVRKGLLSDDELVRIYYGTLRIGIDMHDVEPGWIKTSGDSLTMTLPKIGLLDRDFIDEARTKSFFESGTWNAEAREAMYKRAYARMLAHCLTKENLLTARSNADIQLRRMMRSMGFNHVNIIYK